MVNGRPCTRDKGKYVGFLVNYTAIDAWAGNLPDPENIDRANERTACENAITADAEKLPGFVLPDGKLRPENGEDALEAQLGDVVVAYNKVSGAWVYGIVSDVGPSDKLGEGSIAFNRILKSGYKTMRSRPENYRPDIYEFVIKEPRISVLLLPGTAKRLRLKTHGAVKFDFAPANVAKVAFTAFLEWGTGKTQSEWLAGDKKAAWDRFRACQEVLASQK